MESASLKMFCSGVESLAQVRSAPDPGLVPSCERGERLGLAGVPRVKTAFPVLFGIKKEGAERMQRKGEVPVQMVGSGTLKEQLSA